MGVFLEEDTGLTGENQTMIICQCTSKRPEAVAVQGCTDTFAVRVENSGRSIPGLHDGGIVTVKVMPGFLFRFPLPGLRQQNHACQRQRKAVHGQKLQGIVKHLGVRSVGSDDGQNARHISSHLFGNHGFRPCLHAVMVAPDGVDFPVMQQKALGMCFRPAGEGVRGKARMNQCHLRDVSHILQVIVKGTELCDQHHSLVDDGAAGQGTDIGIGILLFKGPAKNVQPPVKIHASGDIFRPSQKALADPWHGPPGTGPQLCRMTGNIPPSQYGNALGLGQPFKDPADIGKPDLILGEEEHPDGIVAWCPEADAFLPGPEGKKFVGQLCHDTDAVAGCPKRITSGPVSHALHNGQRLIDGPV